MFYNFSSTNQHFFTLYIMELSFYDKYIKEDDRTKFVGDEGSFIRPKKEYKQYFSNYQDPYGNKSYYISGDYLKDMRQ